MEKPMKEGPYYNMDLDNQPPYLYKYVPWDKGARAILQDSTMKFTSPNEFNDPFDCRPSYDVDSLRNLHKTRSDLIRQIAAAKGLSPGDYVRNKRVLAYEIKQLMENGELTRRLLSTWGVVSLTNNPLDILMWSHYAENHTGVLFEFKMPRFMIRREGQELVKWAAEHMYGHPITYQNNRPTFHMGEEPDSSYSIKMLHAKSDIWAYEKEYRIADNFRGPGIHRYNRNTVLSSVICGMRMPTRERQKVEEIVADIHSELEIDVSVYPAKEMPTQYALTVPDHPRLDRRQ